MRRTVLLAALASAWIAEPTAVTAPAGEAHADAASEARTPAEVYERKARVLDCLLYVVRDLKARYDAMPQKGDAVLLLLVDPTSSFKNELAQLAAGVEELLRGGPPGLHVGVEGVGSDATAPSMIPSRTRGALEALALTPVDGVKNLLAAVRRSAATLAAAPQTGPKALLLISEENGDGEDDVEATRNALLDAGAAFYALAGEAAFERGWAYDFQARSDPDAGWAERFTPETKRKDSTLYFGGETAFGLIPYRWELELAQTEFFWAQPPRYPVPSGFGYWPLASLAYTSGGRYFLYDFPQHEVHADRAQRRRTLYDTSRLALLAPDLRPRTKILKDLGKDGRARTIVRIWEKLADDALPVIQDLGTLECTATALTIRPGRPVRSTNVPATWYERVEDLEKARAFIGARIGVVDQALTSWAQENAKTREQAPGADPLGERVEADFQLLGAQLKRVRFHLGEAQAALATIRPLDVTQRRARLVPQPLPPFDPKRPVRDLGDADRTGRLADLTAVLTRITQRYAGTPWALLLEKGWLITFTKEVQIIEPDEPEPRRPEPEKKDGKERPAPPPPAPHQPPAPPPVGPRPGSGGGGPTTGG
jgi:hypothetical protein